MSKTENLFRVLVLGGALMSGAAQAQSPEAPRAPAPNVAALKALLPPSEASLAFCSRNDERTCSVDENGDATPQLGVECCWGTSCE